LTGDLLIPNTTNAQHRLDQTPTSTTTSQTFSVYAKAGGYNFVGLRIGASGTSFNLSTGAVSVNGSGSVGSITAVGNGWYRCSIVVAAAAANDIARINVADAATPSASFAGDGTSGLYIWGAQLEAGAFATSYIPTVASQVTRSADAAVMTGANFSSWYRADEGTAYASFTRFGTTGTPYPIGFSGGATPTTNPRISLRTDVSMNIQTQGLTSGGVVSWSTSNYAGSPGFNALANALMAYSASSVAGCVNGNAVTQATPAAGVPEPITTLFIGANGSVNGHIRKIAYYPKRLADAELQGITTV